MDLIRRTAKPLVLLLLAALIPYGALFALAFVVTWLLVGSVRWLRT